MITNWTSESMAWDTLIDKPWYPYIEALRLALVERINGGTHFDAGAPNPGDPETLEVVVDMLPDYDDVPPESFAWHFQDIMSRIIAGGVLDFREEPNWAPGDPDTRFSEASLMAYLGEDRILLASEQVLSEAWALQQYRMLNAMKWRLGGIPEFSAWNEAGDQFKASRNPGYHSVIDFYYFASTEVWVFAGSVTSPKDVGGDIDVWSPVISSPTPYSNSGSHLRAVVKYDQDATDGFQFLP